MDGPGPNGGDPTDPDAVVLLLPGEVLRVLRLERPLHVQHVPRALSVEKDTSTPGSRGVKPCFPTLYLHLIPPSMTL